MKQGTPIISMWMPWANWVGLGWKTIETRLHKRFQNLAGQQIAIHCSLKWDENAIETASPYLDERQINASHRFLRIGGAVCWTAAVTDGRWLTTDDEPKALIECSTPRFGIFLENVKAIEMIPMKGHQGIWYADIGL